MATQLSTAGRDLLVVLGGRNISNEVAIRNRLRLVGWTYKVFYLHYDSKALEKYYWLRCRGLANSGTVENMFLCWRTSIPPGIPQTRKFVDAGSKLYVESMTKAPIIIPKDHFYVSAELKDRSLQSKLGSVTNNITKPPAGAAEAAVVPTSGEAAEAAGPTADVPSGKCVAAAGSKRRRLYKHDSAETEIWFPHDQPRALMREIIHECGGDRVKWVFHGTPAAGNGVLGCVESNCCVIAACEDELHAEHFKRAILQKGVEAFLSGGAPIFGSPFLAAKAQSLVAGCKDLTPKEKKEDESQDEQQPPKAKKTRKSKGAKQNELLPEEKKPKKRKEMLRRRRTTSRRRRRPAAAAAVPARKATRTPSKEVSVAIYGVSNVLGTHSGVLRAGCRASG